MSKPGGQRCPRPGKEGMVQYSLLSMFYLHTTSPDPVPKCPYQQGAHIRDSQRPLLPHGGRDITLFSAPKKWTNGAPNCTNPLWPNEGP